MKSKTYRELTEGERIVLSPWKPLRVACCDCSLVHRFKFQLKGNQLVLQAWRDNRATGQLRRHRKGKTNGRKTNVDA